MSAATMIAETACSWMMARNVSVRRASLTPWFANGSAPLSHTAALTYALLLDRAMLNICIVFAQLERETIQKRVQDAWYARCQRGFKMGGRAPYVFRTEPIIIDGVHTKKLVIEPTEAAFVRKMYDMYIDPRISLRDIATQLTARGVRSFYGKPFSRSTISLILRNPIYAMADLDIYEFFKSQGTEIYNDAADFVGTNGCYYYRSKGSTDNKHKYLQGQMLVLAPSDGFIPSDLWLRGRSFRDGIMTLLLLRPKLIGQITEFEKSLRIKNKVCR